LEGFVEKRRPAAVLVWGKAGPLPEWPTAGRERLRLAGGDQSIDALLEFHDEVAVAMIAGGEEVTVETWSYGKVFGKFLGSSQGMLRRQTRARRRPECCREHRRPTCRSTQPVPQPRRDAMTTVNGARAPTAAAVGGRPRSNDPSGELTVDAVASNPSCTPPTRPPSPPRDFGRPFTMAEAAERLGVTTRLVRRLVSERRIGFVRIGKFIRLRQEDLDAYIESNFHPPEADRDQGRGVAPGVRRGGFAAAPTGRAIAGHRRRGVGTR
jgi:excisionase family DNA binding protein